MSKPRAQVENYAVSRPMSRIGTRRSDEFVWLDGEVVTPRGIVTVYSQSDERRGGYSRYDFVYGGRLYVRTENVERTVRGLAIMAARFAEEVARG
jgi:hypothetical protein